ncbi:MAG TPA: hypothetical protein VJ251_01465 [Stellaceae bacterium]|nr:hypothetical protein [Stellaceae bacterium]
MKQNSGGGAWQKHRHARKRRHVREKATIDHLVQEVYEPKTPDEKHTERSPTTSTGLPVEDQVRKEWDPRGGGLPTFLAINARSQ